MVLWPSFLARALLSESPITNGAAPGPPTTEDALGMLCFETNRIRDETQYNAHEYYFEYYYMGPVSAHDHDYDL